jgi:hypothetical protein
MDRAFADRGEKQRKMEGAGRHRGCIGRDMRDPNALQTFSGRRSWREIAACYGVLVLGIATLCFAAVLVVRSYSPVLFVDQWEVPRMMMASGGHVPASWFWALHGEHRIPILKTLQLMDLYWFGGRNTLLLSAGFAVQLVHLGFLTYLIRKPGGFSRHATAFLTGAAAFCLFCPTQWEILVFGWGIMYQLAYFAASVAVACLILSRRKKGSSRFLLCSVAAGLVAECTLANGALLWPILSLEAWVLRLSKRAQLVLASAGVIAIAVYLVNYRSPQEHSNPLVSLSRPLDVAHYVIAFLGASLRQADPTLSGYTALLGIVFMTGFSAYVLLRRPPEPLFVYCGSMGGFLLLTALVTALGRVNFGLEQAQSSRYQTPAMLFWWVLLTAVIALGTWRTGSAIVANTATIALAAMLLLTNHYKEILDHCMGRAALMEAAVLAIRMDVRDDQYIRGIYPLPEAPFNGYKFLWQRGLALPKTDPARILGLPITSIRRVVPTETCGGNVDTVTTASGAILLTGWAWDKPLRRPISGVVFTNAEGVLIGTGVAGLPRPEVRAAVPWVAAANSGWHGLARAGDAGKVHVYAVLADSNSACRLAEIAAGPRGGS